MSPIDGRRQDVAPEYLHPRLRDGKHPNLHVLVETQVVRVLFDDDNRATGVEYRPKQSTESSQTGESTRSVAARKLVVLSAGALGTPAILERSEVGDSEVLERANVPVRHILPGVGHDYQDHQLLQWTYRSSIPAEDTFDSVINGTRDLQALLAKNDDILSWNGIDASSKIRPTEPEVDNLGAQFRQVWDQDFRNEPSKPLSLMLLVTG